MSSRNSTTARGRESFGVVVKFLSTNQNKEMWNNLICAKCRTTRKNIEAKA